MKNFKTILYDDKEYNSKINTKNLPFVKDLNIKPIIENIVAQKKMYNLEKFFYNPLQESTLLLFRQEIFKDLQNDKIFEIFKDFELFFCQIRKSLKNSDKLNNPLQKASWFHNAVLIYSKKLSKFYKTLEKIDLNSRGLREFRAYLKSYTSSERFLDIYKKAHQIEESFKNIRYTIRIKSGCIELIDESKTIELEKEVDGFFERFAKYEEESCYNVFENFLDIDHVRENILKMVSKKYHDEFFMLEKFYTDFKDFMDPSIKRFDREIQFYISYLEFIKPLGLLYFSYPRISNKKEVQISDFFDILVFLKLQKENKTPVFNDFILTKNQKAAIVTGPNQGGKTTFARALGVIFYLSSLGCLIPAKKAEIFLQDNIYTHFEREEKIANLRSKLEDDLIRIKEILDHETSKSIVIINEIFSSTTLEDATKLSQKVIDKLLETDSFFIFVTFIDELSKYNKDIISLVAQIDRHNNKRTYRIIKQDADGKAYAKSISKKYHLSYEEIISRIK